MTVSQIAEPAQTPPWYANPLIGWLLNEAWDITDTPHLLRPLIHRMNESGMCLSRVRLTIRTLHPQVIGTSFTWNRDTDEVVEYEPPHSILQTEQFLKSPYAAIFEGAGAIRCRLNIPGVALEFPVLEELRAEGATDYVALPLVFSDGQINAITVATDCPNGFTTAQLEGIYETLPVLARLLEVHATRRMARTLLDTYLGAHTGEQVLSGNIKRGDGEDIRAVIWFCDLRDSTPLADSMSREAFPGVLNDYYDCMAGAILDHGGEVLRFIGDAALAIFPTGEGSSSGRQCGTMECACEAALAAVTDAQARIATLNEARSARGEPALHYGIALHIGDLTYGNIGVPGRLEFTVIGAAANEAARLEGLCKTLGHPVLVSGTFAEAYPGDWISLGRQSLRGVGAPQEVFTFAEAARSAA